MRCSSSTLIALTVGVSALFVPASAFADIVNVTTGATLFSDTFEATSPVSTAAYQDTTGDYDPAGGDPGSWTIREANDYGIQVTNHLGGGDPGAYQGSNYLRVRRAGSAYEDVIMNFDSQATPGDRIRWTQMVCLPSADINAAAALEVYNGTFDVYVNGGSLTGGAVGSFGSGSGAGEDTGLVVVGDTWQKWQFDYAMGASTFDLSIGGATSTGLAITPMTSWSFVSVSQYSLSSSPFYLDEVAVPEPSTAALALTSGLLGLLAYAWKKRR